MTTLPKTSSTKKKGVVKASHKPVKRKKVLGKGLEALLGKAPMEARAPHHTSTQGEDIPIAHIEANPYQPRKDFDKNALQALAESIKIHGIIQPITVRRIEASKYQLISGERRLHACRLASLEAVPAFVREANDQSMLEMALVENIQREELHALDISLSYQRLISECQLKQEELARRVGKERSTVTNYLRLLRLPPTIQAALRDKHISMGHARSLVSIQDPIAQLALLQAILKKGLSVRQTEIYVQNLSSRTRKKPPSPQITAEHKAVEKKLCAHLEAKVRLKSRRKNQGELCITYASYEDLNRILNILGL